MIIGYTRVSTTDQNTARQLADVHTDKLFTDHASGKNTQRPQLTAALDYAREGDTFVIHSMDRLARNLIDLRNIVTDLTSRGVAVRFIKENLTFTGKDNPMDTLLLSMLGAVAEYERSIILERQREGIAVAKAAGKYRGGKPKLTQEQTVQLRTRRASGESPTRLAEEYGVSRATVYNLTKTG